MRRIFRYALARLAAQAVLMVALGVLPIVLVAEPLTVLHRRGLFLPALGKEAYDQVINMIVGPLLTLAVVASVVLAARYIDRRPLREYGLILDRLWWRGLALGVCVSAVVMSCVFSLELLVGWVAIAGFALPLLFSLVKVICVGIYEEVYSRGYLLRNIADASNMTVAVIVTSAIFAALHLFTPNASPASLAALFVNGLFFAAGYLFTGRLSTAIGLHAAWNFFEGAVFGFPVSGDKEGASLLSIVQSGPVWMTGGAYGPEGGAIGVIASLVGVAVLWRQTIKKENACVIEPG